jgi:phospholipid/cholesterol/gamma-HCH transport system substrate-binding protein
VKGMGAAIKVGLVVLVVTILGYIMFKSVSEQASGSGGYHLWARFRDASGLVDKSRVVIAGLTIGEITDRQLDGRFARVTVRVRKDTQVWSNAAIFKKSSSLLGEFYLEIDPGTPESLDPSGKLAPNTLLKDGDEIKVTVEATSVSDLLAQATKILPHVDEVLINVRDLAADARQLVNGPIANMAHNLDNSIAQDTQLVHSILERADRISADIAEATNGSGPRVTRILGNVEDASRDLKDLIATTKGEIQMTGEDIRQKLAHIDAALAQAEQGLGHASSIAQKIDEDQGTLGKLVNESTIADNVEQITEDVKGFTQGLFNLQTIVGIRAEYNLTANLARAYLSIELWTRPDKYYLVEFSADPRGDFHNTFVVDANQNLVRVQNIDSPGLRFTLQYAKKFDWLTLRGGVKESTGGIGADADLFGGRIHLSLDAYQFTFDALPRVRVAVSYHFWKYLYIIGGIDDIVNEPDTRTIAGNDVSGDLPKTYYFGREPYVGLALRFNDEDLRTLLFIGGGAAASLAK